MIDTIHSVTKYSVVDTGDGRANGIWTFSCIEHGEFKSTWRSVKRELAHCPKCGNCGYKSTIAGTLYLNTIHTLNGEFIAIKYGITNCKLNKRLSQLRSNGLIIENVMYVKFKNGREALDIETEIKRLFGGRYLSKEIFGNGYTETLSPSLLKDVKQFIINMII